MLNEEESNGGKFTMTCCCNPVQDNTLANGRYPTVVGYFDVNLSCNVFSFIFDIHLRNLFNVFNKI